MYSLQEWQLPLAKKQEDAWAASPYVLSALPMGSGKTFLACDAIAKRKRPTLVIAPKATHTAWKDVAENMGAGPYLLGVTNPERISLGKSPYYDGKQWTLPAGAQVVADEIQKGASGVDSKYSLAIARLKVWKIPALLMSATPADSPLKMRALGFVLGCHEWNTGSFYSWARRAGCFPTDYGLMFPKGELGEELMRKIREPIKDKIISLKIGDIPGFPDGIVESVLVDLDKDDRIDMAKAYAEMSERIKQPGKTDLAQIIKLRERAEWCKTAVMSELICDAVDAGNSVVCFCTFRSCLARIAEMIGTRHSVVQMHGSQSMDERDQSISKFQANEVPVILGMIQCSGTGVSLHDVHKTRPRVSFITPSYNASETVQALGRIRRVGGTRTVQQFILAAGIEQKVHKAIQGKLGRIESLTNEELER